MRDPVHGYYGADEGGVHGGLKSSVSLARMGGEVCVRDEMSHRGEVLTQLRWRGVGGLKSCFEVVILGTSPGYPIVDGESDVCLVQLPGQVGVAGGHRRVHRCHLLRWRSCNAGNGLGPGDGARRGIGLWAVDGDHVDRGLSAT